MTDRARPSWYGRARRRSLISQTWDPREAGGILSAAHPLTGNRRCRSPDRIRGNLDQRIDRGNFVADVVGAKLRNQLRSFAIRPATTPFIRSAISGGGCDAVSIARPLIANNDLVKQ